MYSLEEMHVVRSISVANGMTLSACLPLPNNKTVLLGSKVIQGVSSTPPSYRGRTADETPCSSSKINIKILL